MGTETLSSATEKRTDGGVGGLVELVELSSSTAESVAAIMTESDGLSRRSTLSVDVPTGEGAASESDPSGTGGRRIG